MCKKWLKEQFIKISCFFGINFLFLTIIFIPLFLLLAILSAIVQLYFIMYFCISLLIILGIIYLSIISTVQGSMEYHLERATDLIKKGKKLKAIDAVYELTRILSVIGVVSSPFFSKLLRKYALYIKLVIIPLISANSENINEYLLKNVFPKMKNIINEKDGYSFYKIMSELDLRISKMEKTKEILKIYYEVDDSFFKQQIFEKIEWLSKDKKNTYKKIFSVIINFIFKFIRYFLK